MTDPRKRPPRRRQSRLDTFLINGKPIGHCTPEEALAYAAKLLREAEIIRLHLEARRAP